jgi:hypothetical protein
MCRWRGQWDQAADTVSPRDMDPSTRQLDGQSKRRASASYRVRPAVSLQTRAICTPRLSPPRTTYWGGKTSPGSHRRTMLSAGTPAAPASRGKGGLPRPFHHLPDGRSRGATRPVPAYPGDDRRPQTKAGRSMLTVAKTVFRPLRAGEVRPPRCKIASVPAHGACRETGSDCFRSNGDPSRLHATTVMCQLSSVAGGGAVPLGNVG